jgi:hypothetical protein
MNAASPTEADERLLDATLQQLLQPPASAASAAPASGLRRAWFAAAALLGIAVVVGTMVLSRQEAAVPAVQDPEPRVPVIEPPLPLEVFTQNVEQIDALPPETQNLRCKLWAPSELANVQRLTALRRLVIQKDVQPTGGAGPSGPELWTDPKPQLLAPLLALPELREISWPQAMRVQAKHVEALVAAPQLQSMTFVCDRVVQGPELADALAKLPRLAELGFLCVPIQSGFLDRLVKLPLSRLSFLGCPGLDDDALQKISTMRSLRALSLTCLNGGSAATGGGRSLPLGKLTAAGLTSIGRLPALRELGLDESELGEELLQLLPPRLEKLDLGNRFVSFGVATAVKPMAGLRDLTVGTGLGVEGAERMASLLGTLRLQRLDYRGMTSAPLLQAIARQPELETLSLKLHGGEDLAPFAQAPRLRNLDLSNTKDGLRPRPVTLDVLRPLAGCKALRRLRLVDCELGAAEVQALLGGEVQVEVITCL